ncbi:FadR family transcriptional regulator [Fodinisporobacter ferrooxydans]|uniref:FadR family transcriptional regulator n=1 Tax=Fodinisporobacter ferrooxydans TaxID=2901836 RepID=A0ABY4CPU2_9BACL|nr:FadR family transcriptional regulator [Alicyclobacillaceae bacterium MYW30-H2]
MTIQKIRKTKVTDEVVEQLKTLIQQGFYKTGEKLPPEKELAKQFGVSRASIREALSVLSAAQIVEARQGEGSFVQTIDVTRYIPPVAVSILSLPEQTLHLLEVRKILEASAAELAAERATEEDLEQLEAAVHGYLDEIQMGQIGQTNDLLFHQVLAMAARNPVLVEMMQRISDLVREGMRYTLEQNMGNEERKHEVYEEHLHILQAIKNRNSEAARQAMITHLDNVRKKILRQRQITN